MKLNLGPCYQSEMDISGAFIPINLLSVTLLTHLIFYPQEIETRSYHYDNAVELQWHIMG